jgi:hypothetical protein
MAHVEEISKLLPSAEGIKRGLEFKCRPDDFLICTSPKCGTTLMQQVLLHASQTHPVFSSYLAVIISLAMVSANQLKSASKILLAVFLYTVDT